MILFLYGPDDFRLNQKLGEIASQYNEVHGSNLSVEKLNANQISFSDFFDVLNVALRSRMYRLKVDFFLFLF